MSISVATFVNFRHADNLGAINLFEILRESIYKEVAALISQNENRPQYLLQVFSELQKMASDVMRQRALFAIQEIGQSSLSRYSGEAIVKNEVTHPLCDAQCCE